jgi:excisionase family DNA binding protein
MGLNSEIVRIVRDVIEQELPKRVRSELENRAASSPKPGPSRMFTVAEVAAALRVEAKTVRSWIARGILRAVKKPGMKEYRIAEGDLLAFSAANGYASEVLDLDKEASRLLASVLEPRKGRG